MRKEITFRDFQTHLRLEKEQPSTQSVILKHAGIHSGGNISSPAAFIFARLQRNEQSLILVVVSFSWRQTEYKPKIQKMK